jgi:hypothetical protein
MFDMPKSIMLGSRTFDIQEDESLRGNPNHLGLCLFDSKLLMVKSNLDPETKEEVFWHELIHAVLGTMERRDLTEDEGFVDLFSQFILQALRTAQYEEPEVIKKPKKRVKRKVKKV